MKPEENYKKGVDTKFDLGTGKDFGLYGWDEKRNIGSMGNYGRRGYSPFNRQMQGAYQGNSGMFGINGPMMDMFIKQLLVMYLVNDIAMQAPMANGGQNGQRV